MGKKLYVGNLPFSITDEALGSIFAQGGTVEYAKIITDRYSGRSKGFGFVEMATDAEAADCLAKLNGTEYEGRSITVAEARPQDARPPRGEGRGFSNRPRWQDR